MIASDLTQVNILTWSLSRPTSWIHISCHRCRVTNRILMRWTTTANFVRSHRRCLMLGKKLLVNIVSHVYQGAINSRTFFHLLFKVLLLYFFWLLLHQTAPWINSSIHWRSHLWIKMIEFDEIPANRRVFTFIFDVSIEIFVSWNRLKACLGVSCGIFLFRISIL